MKARILLLEIDDYRHDLYTDYLLSSFGLSTATGVSVHPSFGRAGTVCKGIFINGGISKGEQYLLSTDLALTFQHMITTYQKRRGVEEYHKSLK